MRMTVLFVLLLVLAPLAHATEIFQMVRATGNPKADQWQSAAADGYLCAQMSGLEMALDQAGGQSHTATHYLEMGRKCLEEKARSAGINLTSRTRQARRSP